MLKDSVLWGPLGLCGDEWEKFTCHRRWSMGRPIVNVIMGFVFALIKKQREPCQALWFVNGPSDAPGVRSVCTRTEIATLTAPRLNSVDSISGRAPLAWWYVFTWSCHRGVYLQAACLCKYRIHEVVGSVCGCHQHLRIPSSLSSNKKQGLHSV